MKPHVFDILDDHPITYVGIPIADGTVPHMGDHLLVIDPLCDKYGKGGTMQRGHVGPDGKLRLILMFGKGDYVGFDPRHLVYGDLKGLKKHFPRDWRRMLDEEG